MPGMYNLPVPRSTRGETVDRPLAGGVLSPLPAEGSSMGPLVCLLVLMSSPVRIAVLGDRTAEGDDAGIFAACVERAAGSGADIIVCVGDLIEGYTDDPGDVSGQWEEVLSLTTPAFAGLPLFLTPGNHDIWSSGSAQAWSDASGAPPSGIEVIEGVTLVSWDTSRRGTLSAEALDDLGALLSLVDPGASTVLVTHRPFWCMEGTAPGELAAMREMIEEAGVETVLAGHIHIFCSERVGGVLYVSAGPSGGRSLPLSISGGTLPQVGLLTVDGDSVRYVSLLEHGTLTEGADTGLERGLLGLFRKGGRGRPPRAWQAGRRDRTVSSPACPYSTGPGSICQHADFAGGTRAKGGQ